MMTIHRQRYAPKYPLETFHHVAREAGLELLRNVQVPDAMVGMGLINVNRPGFCRHLQARFSRLPFELYRRDTSI